MAARGLRLYLWAAVVAVAAGAAAAHNITAILDGFPDYSVYNGYLTQTKVADEINSRETVTCLVLSNSAMTALAAKHTLAAIKNALRLLTLLDYFDGAKLHDLPRGTTLTTTLLQTTGNEPGNLGFVNITNLRGGRVAFASAAPGSKPEGDFTKSVKQLPYSLSVLEISAPVTFPGLFDVPDAATANLTQLLNKAGCKTFAALAASSGVLKTYQAAMDKGLTLFAPNDEAFKAEGVPDLASLTSAETVALLQYHALPQYAPKATLKDTKGSLPTLASSGAGKFDLSVTSRGDDVTLDTGLDTSRVASTVLDDTPVCVLTVDNVLLPVELFGKAPAPAPGPAGLSPSLSPSPTAEAPTPAPASAKAPAPERASPPAPPTATPEGSPAGSPDAADQKATADNSSATRFKSVGSAAAALFAMWALAASL